METLVPVSLLNSLDAQTVAVQVPAANWEEAVEQAGRLLVSAGFVEETYVKAMQETIRTVGAYLVIAPGIAMPHARPEAGVKQTGFSLITLEKPVEFGSEENDPVDIVIGFAATDKSRHIKALQEIAIHFSNDEFIRSIRSAQSKEALLGVIQKERKGS
jgi:mannitol/fructose-specific phosphotransferase system IIA component (Ntr-type)